jgi:hypothetical protein
MARYRTSLWLLGLAVLFGGLAYRIYPGDAPVGGSDAIQGVTVYATFAPNAIVVDQTPDPSVNGFKLQIVIHDSAQVEPESGTITIALPSMATGSYQRCPAPAFYCTHPSAGLKEATFHFPLRWHDAGPNVPTADRFELRLTTTVADTGSNVSRNAEYVAVLMPPISFQQGATAAAPYVPVQTVYAEQIPDDNYTWATGTSPDYVNGFDRWTGTSAQALQDAASPTLETGTDLAVQDRNGNLQFIAGIVVGIAGGALVGSLQEFLDTRKKGAEAAT